MWESHKRPKTEEATLSDSDSQNIKNIILEKEMTELLNKYCLAMSPVLCLRWHGFFTVELNVKRLTMPGSKGWNNPGGSLKHTKLQRCFIPIRTICDL